MTYHDALIPYDFFADFVAVIIRPCPILGSIAVKSPPGQGDVVFP